MKYPARKLLFLYIEPVAIVKITDGQQGQRQGVRLHPEGILTIEKPVARKSSKEKYGDAASVSNPASEQPPESQNGGRCEGTKTW